VAADAVPLTRLVPTPPPPTQAEARLSRLVARIQAGEVDAFTDLYRLTRDDVCRTLFHLVGARPDLEDLVQETYVALLKALRHFRGQSSVRTFVYRVCTNTALMQLRWWRRRPEELPGELPELSCETDPEKAAQAAQATRLVHQALAGLSAKKRVVFVYHELCGMGPEEIAQATDTPYNTVRSRLHAARAEFTAALRTIVAQQVTP
jgi:RNA polymerase sigma-70 factor, ECF subfamily